MMAETTAKRPPLDVGFRVLKVDEHPATELDFFFWLLETIGMVLSVNYNTELIGKCKCWTAYDPSHPEDSLIATWAKDIPDSVFYEIAMRKTSRVVFFQAAFKDKDAEDRACAIFEKINPSVKMYVL